MSARCTRHLRSRCGLEQEHSRLRMEASACSTACVACQTSITLPHLHETFVPARGYGIAERRTGGEPLAEPEPDRGTRALRRLGGIADEAASARQRAVRARNPLVLSRSIAERAR
jgi:hypothetical protein